ncbi:MAG TPA: hypothetical protein VFB79_07870 [Candidatus Angelobacter sp.]|nr:hypothetical protein [Candidatus Angelobacter sp.]
MHQTYRPLLPNTIDYIIAPSGENGKKRSGSARSPERRKDTSSKPAKARVLLFSGMRELALYRAEVLRGNGFNVIVPRSKEDAILAIQHGAIDVAVFTYTLPNETVHELTQLLREHCPDCRLVVVSEAGHIDRKIEPDATVSAMDGPAGLIDALHRLTRLQ